MGKEGKTMNAVGTAAVADEYSPPPSPPHIPPLVLLPPSPSFAVGMIHRDPRMVERKKPGQKKARKQFQWVRR
jgi:hypothetical protein